MILWNMAPITPVFSAQSVLPDEAGRRLVRCFGGKVACCARASRSRFGGGGIFFPWPLFPRGLRSLAAPALPSRGRRRPQAGERGPQSRRTRTSSRRTRGLKAGLRSSTTRCARSMRTGRDRSTPPSPWTRRRRRAASASTPPYMRPKFVVFDKDGDGMAACCT